MPGDDARTLALIHAGHARPALSALLALDAVLGQVVRTTTQPLVGQLRLTWWHERLCALDADTVAAEPVLRSLADHVLPGGVSGADLAVMVEGWEPLLDAPPLTDGMVEAHGAHRGARLFALAAVLLGGRGCASAGAGWALTDLAAHWSNDSEAMRIQAAARNAFARSTARLPRSLRVLSRLARAKARGPLAELGLPPTRLQIMRAILP